MQNKKIYLEPQTKAVVLKFTHALLAGSPGGEGQGGTPGGDGPGARFNDSDFAE